MDRLIAFYNCDSLLMVICVNVRVQCTYVGLVVRYRYFVFNKAKFTNFIPRFGSEARCSMRPCFTPTKVQRVAFTYCLILCLLLGYPAQQLLRDHRNIQVWRGCSLICGTESHHRLSRIVPKKILPKYLPDCLRWLFPALL